MDHRSAIRPFVIASAGVITAALALAPPSSQAQGPFELNLGSLAPKGTPWMDALEKLEAQIEKDSNGRINVIVRPPGVVGEVEMVRETLAGERLQGCGVTTGAIAEGADVPQLSLLELPFLFETNAEADHVLDEVLFAPMSQILAKRGLTLALWSENGWRSFATKDGPVTTPGDLKDLEMRSQESDVHVKMYEAFGGKPVQKPMTEVLAALQSDALDGLDNTALYIQAGGLAEPIDYFTLTRHIYQPAAIVYNKRWFDTLPADLQQVVLAPKGLTQEGRTAIRAEEVEMIESLELFAVEVVELSPEQRAAFAKVAHGMHEGYAASIEGGTDLLARINAGLAEKRK